MANALEIFNEYLAAQSSGDVDKVMELISKDAIFDVGRGQFTGDNLRQFHERLQSIHSRTTPVMVEELGPDRLSALLDQYDDDLKPLGIDKIQLEAEIVTDDQGRIQRFAARPNAESLARIMAARAAGHNSEGADLAERAGNLPPKR